MFAAECSFVTRNESFVPTIRRVSVGKSQILLPTMRTHSTCMHLHIRLYVKHILQSPFNNASFSTRRNCSNQRPLLHSFASECCHLSTLRSTSRLPATVWPFTNSAKYWSRFWTQRAIGRRIVVAHPCSSWPSLQLIQDLRIFYSTAATMQTGEPSSQIQEIVFVKHMKSTNRNETSDTMCWLPRQLTTFFFLQIHLDTFTFMLYQTGLS